MKVAILNDTYGPHVGCQLVSEAMRTQLDRVGIELLGTVHKTVRRLRDYPAFVGQADLVLVNGEGSIHHGQRLELVEAAALYPAILFNCVFEENPPLPALGQFRYISARESLSAAAIREQGVACEVIPDVILTAPTLRDFPRGMPTEELGITDNVLDRAAGFTALVGEGNAAAYLHELCRYRKLCVGRFHAALMAASLGIPFAAWASNTHKTRGLMLDMGIPQHFADTQAEALAKLPDALPETVARYVEEGRGKVDALFERLHTFV